MLAWILNLDFSAGTITIGNFLCFFSEQVTTSSLSNEAVASSTFTDESVTVCS